MPQTDHTSVEERGRAVVRAGEKREKGEKREAMAESDSCLERICVAAGSGTMLGCIVGAGVSAPI